MKRQLLFILCAIVYVSIASAQHRSSCQSKRFINTNNSQADINAPIIVSTTPTSEGEAVYTLRPIIRIEYDEELNWDEDKNSNCITITDANCTEYAGKVTHNVVHDKSVIHFYFSNDLPLDKALLVKVSGGLSDLFGNTTEDFYFRFLSEYRPMITQETILTLDNTTGWWPPNGSGSTKGLTAEDSDNTWDVSSSVTASQESESSCWLHYAFNPTSTDGLWQIRQYYSSGSTTSHNNINGILSFWLYGDASNNSVSAMLRATSSSGGLKYQDPQTKIDFRGWKLITWDLKNDAYTSFTGTDALTAIWRFDSFFLRHITESNIDTEWNGGLYFDNLEFNTWDNSATRKAQLNDVKIPASNIEDITSFNNDPIEYFNPQGIKVNKPQKGIYIKRQGSAITKIVL